MAFETSFKVDTNDLIFYFETVKKKMRMVQTGMSKDDFARFEKINLEILTQAVANSSAESIKEYQLELLKPATAVAVEAAADSELAQANTLELKR